MILSFDNKQSKLYQRTLAPPHNLNLRLYVVLIDKIHKTVFKSCIIFRVVTYLLAKTIMWIRVILAS
jgi:hypothetical protein